MKRSRKTPGSKVLAIKNAQDKVVYKLNEVLEVWRKHFSTLSTHRDNPNYDGTHHAHVTDSVQGYNKLSDLDEFIIAPFTTDEVSDAIKKLSYKRCLAMTI